MGEAGWKKFETRVARWFRGKRRGAATSDAGGGRCDVLCEQWSPEVTLQRSIGYAELVKKCKQAEKNAEGRTPVVIAKKSNLLDANALVVFRAETFARLFLDWDVTADAPVPEDAGLDEPF